MNKILLSLVLSVISLQRSIGQETATNVSFTDVTNFWTAYDSINDLKNTDTQIELMKRLYIKKASPGLLAFMDVRNFDEKAMVKAINQYPKFWNSIRPNTLQIMQKKQPIDRNIKKFKEIYPGYREAQIYFCISPIRSGGTTQDSLVLIGTEIATGNQFTDVSEFPDKRLENFFKTQKMDNVVPFTIHEYVHTQQKTEGNTLLGQSIYEGACDFITELVLGKDLQHAYLIYGKKHEEVLKKSFKKEMLGTDLGNWLYNGSNAEQVGDLGYFMGYAICWAYYKNARNKQVAINEIIELDYSDTRTLQHFLKKSKYFLIQ